MCMGGWVPLNKIARNRDCMNMLLRQGYSLKWRQWNSNSILRAIAEEKSITTAGNGQCMQFLSNGFKERVQ